MRRYRFSGGPIGLHSGSSISISFDIYWYIIILIGFRPSKHILLVKNIFLCLEISLIVGVFFCTVFRLHWYLTKSWNSIQTIMNFVVLLAKHSCEHEQLPPPSANVSDILERVPRNLVKTVFSFPMCWVKDVSGPGNGASRLFSWLGSKGFDLVLWIFIYFCWFGVSLGVSKSIVRGIAPDRLYFLEKIIGNKRK